MGDDRRGLRFAACCLLLITIGITLRLSPLTRYVTPDEPAWVHRSITFGEALSNRDWSAIPTTGHPGVTTMWLGAAATWLQKLLRPDASSVHLDWIQRLAWLSPENGQAFRHLAFFLPGGRIAVALTVSVLLAAIAAAINRLWGQEAALLALGLLAFDPFLIGHSGLLHTDALLASLCVLAVLAALKGACSTRPYHWWALAGLATGLAILTKTPGVILIPFMPIVGVAWIIMAAQSSPRPVSRIATLAAQLLLYITSAGATVLALYPAMWTNPLGVLQSIGGFAGSHLATVQRPVFFAGDMTYDPGVAFYPLVLAFRSSPIVLVGLILGFVRLPRLDIDRRFSFLVLVAFAVLFGAVMTVGAKKHDRYLLPALVSLSVATSLVFNSHAGLTARARSIVFVLVGLQACIALAFAIHPLTYFNPLLGGPALATRILPSGWGEAMGSAAAWLNQIPGAQHLTVAAVSPPSFAPTFVGRTVPLDEPSVALADYVVDFPPGLTEAEGLAGTIVQTLAIGSLNPVVVISNTDHIELARYLESRTGAGDLIVVDAHTPLLRLYRGEAALECAADKPDERSIAEWLSEIMPDSESVWLISSVGASPITSAQLERQLTSLGTPAIESTYGFGSVTQYIPDPILSTIEPEFEGAVYGGELELVDTASPADAAWPESLRVTLRWRTPAPLPSDYRTVVALRDATGFEWGRLDRLILNSVTFPTSAWAPGEWSDASYVLRLPAGIPPGDYSVEVGVYDGATGAGRGAVGADGRFLGTQIRAATVSVLPPTAPPGLADLQVPLETESPSGSLELMGLDPPQAQVLSGDYLSLFLFWEARTQPEVDYRARLTLTGASGEHVFQIEQPLSVYATSQWEAGQRFRTHHFVHVSPTLPADDYSLTLNLVDDYGRPAWSTDQPLATTTVLNRERSFELPSSISLPLDYQFGDQAHLVGCSLDQTELTAGQAVQLTLYWQAKGPTQTEFSVFIHLLDSGRIVRGQVDLIPGSGMAPTTSWAPGQVIVDGISIPLDQGAPPGLYQIALGFYDHDYGTRLPVTDASGDVLAGDQAILPFSISVLGGTP